MKLSTLSATTVPVFILMAVLQASCSAHAQPALAQQYIPPDYYNCSVTTPGDLGKAYFGRYNNIAAAEQEFNNQVFVFKNMVITDSELKYATEDYLWLDNIIQCYFLNSGSARQLKVGEEVDVVGIDAGVCKDYAKLLVFNGCIFLPAGSVQLPAGGGSGLTIPSY
jgi:hypothetical protein